MSTDFARYEVYWTPNTAKKHKNWSSGFLRWNPHNNQGTLYDEDDAKVLGEAFIVGGPQLGKEYVVGANKISIEGVAAKIVSSSPQVAPSPGTSPPPAKRKMLSTGVIPKKAQRVPVYSKVDVQNNSSSQESSPPPEAPTTPSVSKPIVKKALTRAFKPPAFVAPVVTEEAPNIVPNISKVSSAPVSDSGIPNIPEPVQKPHVIVPWSIFDDQAESSSEEEDKQAENPSLKSVVTPTPSNLHVPSTHHVDLSTHHAHPANHHVPPSTAHVNGRYDEIERIFEQQNEESEEIVGRRTFKSLSNQTTSFDAIRMSKLAPPPPLPPKGSGIQNKTVPTISPFSSVPSRIQTSSSPITTTSTSTITIPHETPIAKRNVNVGQKEVLSSKSYGTDFKSPMQANKPSVTEFKTPMPASKPSATGFKTPAMVNPHESVLGWNSSVLSFPSSRAISTLNAQKAPPRRSVDIPTSYPSLDTYKKVFAEALYEEINHGTLQVAISFRNHFDRIFNQPGGNNPKKPTPPGSNAHHLSPQLVSKLVTAFPQLYTECELISYGLDEKRSKYSKKPSNPQHQNNPNTKRAIYLKLSPNASNQESSASFLKDDLWIISSCLNFEPTFPQDILFLARSTMHGRSSTVMDLKPILEGSFGSGIQLKFPEIDGEIRGIFAIHGPSISTEVSLLENLYDLSSINMPTIPILLNGKWKKLESNSLDDSSQDSFPSNGEVVDSSSPFIDCGLHSSTIEATLKKVLEKYPLNEDQTKVLRRAASWFNARSVLEFSPITLVHGVFGSGKSHMLVVLIIFICAVLDQIVPQESPIISQDLDDKPAQFLDKQAQVRPENIRILVSSATNTAVDRILTGLLDEGMTDFVRVGSLKRIDSRILPYSIHRDQKKSGSGGGDRAVEFSDRAALRDLDDMLKDKSLTRAGRALIEQQRNEIASGRFDAKMELVNQVRVVGATCIASTFPILSARQFQIVILDECSQMPEPLSLLPVGKFGSKALILVGDPMQLPPQLKSKPSNDGKEDEGLGRTLFSRMAQLDHEPIMLRTQYRLHPLLSSSVNQMFYTGKVIDGVAPTDREPLHPSIPTLLVVNALDGSERVSSGGSIDNPHEALIVGHLLQLLLKLGIHGHQIGAICLYKSQVDQVKNLIGRVINSLNNEPTRKSPKKNEDAMVDVEEEISMSDELASIQVSTVDAFQGAEKDVIILTSCRTEWRGFIDSPFRMNVALTRAKRHLILVGHVPTLSGSHRWKTVIDKAKTSGTVVAGHVVLSDNQQLHLQ